MVLVSACLLGLRTRYDGTSAPAQAAIDLLKRGEAIPVCPEQLAGLPTPRPKCTLSGGAGKGLTSGKTRVVTENGEEITERMKEACIQIVELARTCGATSALLKEGSPSCGIKETSIDWKRTPGSGALAAILQKAGLETKGA